MHPRPWMEEARVQARLALPLAAAHAGQQLMSVVDAAIVGRVGARELGAVGLGNAVFTFFLILGMGLMMGLDPLMAQSVGAGERNRARALLWQGAHLAWMISLGVCLGLLAAPWGLRAAGVEAETVALTGTYLMSRLPGVLPTFLFVGARSYLQALSRPRALVAATLLANVLNAVVAYTLVLGGEVLPGWLGVLRELPPMGVAGAGLATSACFLAQWLLSLAFITRMDTPALPAERRPRTADLRQAWRVGAPLALQMGAEVGVFSLVGILAGRLGTTDLAAHQIAIQVASLSFTVSLGVGASGAVRVGHAIGAGDVPGVRRSGVVAFAFGSATMATAALTMLAFPEGLVRLITNQEQVMATAVPLLGVAAAFQLSDGIQAVGAGVLRGAADTRFLSLANVLGHYVLGLPIALYLGFEKGMGITGLWWGLSCGLTGVALALAGRFWVLSSRPIARVS